MTVTLKDVKARANCKKDIVLLAAAVADNGAPATATAGVAVYETNVLGQGSPTQWENGVNFPHQPVSWHQLCIDGGTTPDATFVLWGYLTSATKWFPVLVVASTPFGTYPTYTIRIEGLSAFDRVYLQTDWTAGTISAWLVACQEAF